MNMPVPCSSGILIILFSVLCAVYYYLVRTVQTCSHVFNRILARYPCEPWTQVPPICSDFVHCIGMVSGTSPNLFDECYIFLDNCNGK